jgi:hypothetical protein
VYAESAHVCGRFFWLAARRVRDGCEEGEGARGRGCDERGGGQGSAECRYACLSFSSRLPLSERQSVHVHADQRRSRQLARLKMPRPDNPRLPQKVPGPPA